MLVNLITPLREIEAILGKKKFSLIIQNNYQNMKNNSGRLYTKANNKYLVCP